MNASTSRAVLKNSNPGNPPQLISEKELAEILGVNYPTVHRWRKEGTLEIPHLRLGSSIRYDINDVRELIQARKTAKGGQG